MESKDFKRFDGCGILVYDSCSEYSRIRSSYHITKGDKIMAFGDSSRSVDDLETHLRKISEELRDEGITLNIFRHKKKTII